MGSEQSDGFTSFPEKVVLRRGFFPTNCVLPLIYSRQIELLLQGETLCTFFLHFFPACSRNESVFPSFLLTWGDECPKHSLFTNFLAVRRLSLFARRQHPAKTGEADGRGEGGTGDDDGSLSLSFPLFPLLFKTLLPRPPLSSGVAARLG